MKNAKIFRPRHKVLSVQLLPNGEILTHALKTEFKVVADEDSTEGGKSGFKIEDGSETMVYFKSKAVLIASGAQQTIDSRVLKELLP